MGLRAGQNTQGPNGIAIGNEAGANGQKDFGVGIGWRAGHTNQGQDAIAIGRSAGSTNQGSFSIAIGNSSGSSNQGSSAIAIGNQAGNASQGGEAVAIGTSSGQNSQSSYAVAIGWTAGQATQGAFSVAIGYEAGRQGQGANSIAIGNAAGQGTNTAQGQYAVAIGYYAAQRAQQSGAIAIGYLASRFSQGTNSIAIGTLSGGDPTNGTGAAQAANSIILNASGSLVTGATANATYIAPIRNSTYSFNLGYNPTTSEVIYNSANAISPSVSTQISASASSVTLNLPSVSDGKILDVIAYYTADGPQVDTGVCPNGDTNGGNYYHQLLYGQNLTPTANQNGIAGGRLGYPNTSTIAPTMGKATIGDYRSTSLQKTMITTYGAPYDGNSGQGYILTECCLWKNTAAITQLTFFTNSAGLFRPGSIFTINIIR
jgi:hypothetical protein